jgi:hypothetical protein
VADLGKTWRDPLNQPRHSASEAHLDDAHHAARKREAERTPEMAPPVEALHRVPGPAELLLTCQGCPRRRSVTPGVPL